MKTSAEAFALTRAEMQPAHPITVTWVMGRAKPVEVIRTTMGTVAIIADSIVQVLRSEVDPIVRTSFGAPLFASQPTMRVC